MFPVRRFTNHAHQSGSSRIAVRGRKTCRSRVDFSIRARCYRDVKTQSDDSNEAQPAIRSAELPTDSIGGSDRCNRWGCLFNHALLSRWLFLGGANSKRAISLVHVHIIIIIACRFFCRVRIIYFFSA